MGTSLSPAFRKAERYSRAIPHKTNKTLAIRRLLRMLLAALGGRG